MSSATKHSAVDSYLTRVRDFPLRRLKSDAAHARAKRIYLRCVATKMDRGTRDYLEVLAELIADFEKRAGHAVDVSRLDVADLVRHRLEERALSVTAMAKEIGIAQSNLSEMLSGNRDWSKAAICSVSKYLNIRPERFLIG